MQYLLLIYSDPAEWASKTEAEARAIIGEHNALIDDLKSAGKYLNSNALEDATAATTVRVPGGRVHVTDGPFAETKEQLGGYYLVEAKDLDDAMAIAGRIPFGGGGVEIRPIRDVGL